MSMFGFNILLVLGAVLSMLACGGEGTNSLNFADEFLESDNARLSLLKASSQDVTEHKVDCNTTPERFPAVCMMICHRPPGNPQRSKTMVLPLKAVFAHLVHGGDKHEFHDYMGECLMQDHNEDGTSDNDDHRCVEGQSNGKGKPSKDHDSKDHGSKDDNSHDNDSNDSDSMDHDSEDSDSGDSHANPCAGGTDDENPDSNPGGSDESPDSLPGSEDGSGSTTDSGGGMVGSEIPELPLWCSENLIRDANCDGIDDSTGELIY